MRVWLAEWGLDGLDRGVKTVAITIVAAGTGRKMEIGAEPGSLALAGYG